MSEFEGKDDNPSVLDTEEGKQQMRVVMSAMERVMGEEWKKNRTKQPKNIIAYFSLSENDALHLEQFEIIH